MKSGGVGVDGEETVGAGERAPIPGGRAGALLAGGGCSDSSRGGGGGAVEGGGGGESSSGGSRVPRGGAGAGPGGGGGMSKSWPYCPGRRSPTELYSRRLPLTSVLVPGRRERQR